MRTNVEGGRCLGPLALVSVARRHYGAADSRQSDMTEMPRTVSRVYPTRGTRAGEPKVNPVRGGALSFVVTSVVRHVAVAGAGAFLIL